jgi:anti-sigma-K factor RskA
MSVKHKELTDDLQEQASLYAAGAMTDSERREYARHLEEDECPVCRSEVKELESTASLLAFSVSSAAPSPDVKARLMEQAKSAMPPVPQPHVGYRWLQWVTAVTTVAAVAVAVLVAVTNSQLRSETDLLRSRIAQLEVQLAEQRNNIAVLTRAGVRVVDLAGQGQNVQSSGRIFRNEQQKKWFFYVWDLPRASSGEIYELWFVPKTGNPIRATTFNTDSNGVARVEVPVPDQLPDLKAAAVTNEPAPGLEQPSGMFALLGAF